MTYENRVLRKTFGLKREEVTGGWKIVCNSDFHSFSASPNIITVIKPRRMRPVGFLACMR
jgi:hypothetical protein